MNRLSLLSTQLRRRGSYRQFAMNTTGVPSDFYQRLKAKFESARHDGSLVFTPSTKVNDTVDGIDIRYTLAPALAKKPGAIANEKDKDAAPSLREASPWINPDDKLLVLDKFYKDKYIVVLNKFAVTPGHFLLVTRTFQRQESPLNEDDLVAALALLKATNLQSGRRHLGFFNCGPNSGASMAHKHIQYVPLPENFKPFPDVVDLSGFDHDPEKVPKRHDKAAFSHFIAPTPKELDGEELAVAYSRLLARVFSVFSLTGQPTPNPSYNVVFTEEWMIVTPRRQSQKDGHGVNSLGTVGLILAKSEEELEFFQNIGPFNLMESLGFPASVDVEAGRLEEDLNYTRY